MLSEFFIRRYCKIDGFRVKGLTKQAQAILNSHPFSGNVRKFENIIHRIILFSDSDQVYHFPLDPNRIPVNIQVLNERVFSSNFSA